MRKFAIAGAAAALFAIPAAANAQAFVQAEAGVDSVSIDGEAETGAAYGISGGYDVPLSGGMFVGLQATFADNTTRSCESDEGDEMCAKAGRDVAVVARLGTSFGAKSKIYVFGGYTNARLLATYESEDLNDELGLDTAIEAHSDFDGIRAGAGYQYDLSDTFFVKAEYRYSNYEQDISRHNGIIALGAKF